MQQPAADRDGLRYWGPTRRAMRGKTPRRQLDRLMRGGLSHRTGARDERSDAVDYAPINDAEFDPVCDNCPLRVRISMPDG